MNDDDDVSAGLKTYFARRAQIAAAWRPIMLRAAGTILGGIVILIGAYYQPAIAGNVATALGLAPDNILVELGSILIVAVASIGTIVAIEFVARQFTDKPL